VSTDGHAHILSDLERERLPWPEFPPPEQRLARDHCTAVEAERETRTRVPCDTGRGRGTRRGLHRRRRILACRLEGDAGHIGTWPTRARRGGTSGPAAHPENWATFLRVAAAMASVVSAREFQAASSFPPGWFSELLTMLHYRQATIISLNYDRLVEVGVQSHRFWAEPLRTVTVSDVLGDLPPRVRPIMATPPSPLIPALSSAAGPSELPALVPTFHLLKLHGSLGWYTAGARELADLRRVDNWSRFGSPVADDEAARRRELPNTLS